MDDQSRFASTLEDFGNLLDVDPKKLQDLLEQGSIQCEECKPNRGATWLASGKGLLARRHPRMVHRLP